jgi:hypothetical protein
VAGVAAAESQAVGRGLNFLISVISIRSGAKGGICFPFQFIGRSTKPTGERVGSMQGSFDSAQDDRSLDFVATNKSGPAFVAGPSQLERIHQVKLEPVEVRIFLTRSDFTAGSYRVFQARVQRVTMPPGDPGNGICP